MHEILFDQCNIYQFQIDPKIFEEVMFDFKNSKLFWKKIEFGNNTFSGYLDSNYIFPWYHQKLFDWFDECLIQVSNKHYFGKKFSIVDSWLTSYNPGSNAQPHTHDCSILSGLFYMTSHEHSETVFKYFDPWLKDVAWMLGIDKAQTIEVPVKPTAGKLLIWKSSYIHGVNMHRETKPRHTLAFNAFFDGRISYNPTMHLELNCVNSKDRYQRYLETRNSSSIEK